MTKTNLALIKTDAPDELAGLVAEKRRLLGETSSFREQRERLNRFAADETRILGELNTLAASEAAAIREWAVKAKGDPPAPMTKEREGLARNLADARARAGAAGIAGSEIDKKLLEAGERIAEVEAKIEARVFDRVADEYESVISRAMTVCIELRGILCEKGAIHEFFRDEYHRAFTSSKMAEAQRIAQFAEQRLPVFNWANSIDADAGGVEAARASLRSRMARWREGGE